jgi:hypothetical protein
MFSQNLMTLAQWLAGEFDNQSQAQDQPAWFVHLRWWHRPLPFLLQGNLALFAEQANALYLDQPYRQRLLLLKEKDAETWRVHYLALKQPEQFRGAGANPALLRSLTPDDCQELPGCTLTVQRQFDRFVAKPAPEDKCYFQYEGKQRQVVLGFEVRQTQYLSFDRGVDPETGAGLWGALMGAYELDKQKDFADEFKF